MPRPNQAMTLPAKIKGQLYANANKAFDVPLKKYPATAIVFLCPKRSDSQPAPSFTKLEVASATPSIVPNAAAGNPRTAKKPGSKTVAIS